MGDAITEHTTVSREHARIDSTLNSYFNFAAGDVGLRSNHAATVAVLVNRKNRTVANADAAEEAMFQAVEAVTRHRAVSAILARLSEHDRHELWQCYASRRWPGELAARPAAQRWFAASSPAVRNYLRARSNNGWTPDAGEALLVLAEQVSPDPVELEVVRVEAWTFAERVVGALFDRYSAAERAVLAEAAAERERRLGTLGARARVARANQRRPS
jgi:hypothetical protein